MPAPDQEYRRGVDHIIGKDPAWIVRWGTVVVFGVVVVLLLISYLVKYPDLVTTRVTLTSVKPPVRVVARTSGKLDEIFVTQAQEVAAGQDLALVENTARYADVKAVEAHIAAFEVFLTRPYQQPPVDWPRSVRLGELADAYSTFLKRYLDWRNLLEQDYLTARIEGLEAQRSQFEALAAQLQTRAALLDEEKAILEQQYGRQERLFKQAMVAETALQNARSALLSQQIQRENLNESIIRNKIARQELEETLLALGQERGERNRASLLDAQEAFKLLRESLETWQQHFLLRAPASGRVSFFHFWSNDQYVMEGEEVMTILPPDDELVGRIFLPQTGAGRVATGQRVRIKLDSYPYQEFGIVSGEVAVFSAIARENTYLLDVELSSGLKTSYDKELEFKYGMQGTAEIITKEMRLLERIFNRFRYLVDSRL